MKLKYILTLALVAVFGVSPAVGYAAYNDAHLDTGTIITVGGVNLVVAGGADSDSIVVDGGTLTLTMTAGSYLRVTSADRRAITASNLGATQVSSSCTDSQSQYTYETPSGSATVTLTVESSTCSTNPGGGGGVGGGGGGGGGSSSYTYVPPTTTPAPAVTATPTPAVTSAPAIRAISGTVDRLLTKGMTNPGIKILQQILNSDPDTRIAATGVGSPGSETTFFGPATLKAVQKFQVKYGIAKPGDSGYGNVGPLTRTILNSLAGSVVAPASTVAPVAPAASLAPGTGSASPIGTISRNLGKGMTNASVKILQKILNSDTDTMIAETGTGSPGSETNFFGGATLKALQKFQVKHGIAGPGEEGYGNVGPKTRAKLNEIGAKGGGVDQQVEDAMKQIKALQDQLQVTQ